MLQNVNLLPNFSFNSKKRHRNVSQFEMAVENPIFKAALRLQTVHHQSIFFKGWNVSKYKFGRIVPVAFLVLSQLAHASVNVDESAQDRSSSAQFSDQAKSIFGNSLVVDESEDNTGFGGPDSLAVSLSMENGPLATFETPDDNGNADVDLNGLTDDQVEALYNDDLQFTQDQLDKVVSGQESLDMLGTNQVASRKKNAGHASMSALTCLAVAIQGEAGGESDLGKKAVANVVLARAGGSSGRVCGAVFARAQFESMDGRHRAKVSAASLRAAKQALSGKGGRCAYPGDHFINKNLQRKLGRPIPCWVRNFESWGCKGTKVGQQIFYNSCKCNGRGKTNYCGHGRRRAGGRQIRRGTTQRRHASKRNWHTKGE